MHYHFQDPFIPGGSPIHQLDPRVKIILTFAFIITVALIPDGAWPAFLLLLSMVLSIEILSEVSILFVQKRAVIVFPFVLASLPLIFTIEGTNLISLTFGPWLLSITQPGIERFFSILIKSWLSVQAAIILTTCTSFPDLLIAMRAVKIPRQLVAIFSMMWRYLFILFDEALRLLRARYSRSSASDAEGTKPGRSMIWRARITGAMAGSLFLRSIERSDRIYWAMASRGYDGDVRAFPQPQVKSTNRLVLAVGLLILLLILTFTYLL